jgi:hypothetical protein
VDDETYRNAGKAIRRQMALEGAADEEELASWASLPIDKVLPLTAGLPGPWPWSVMIAVSVALDWPADGVERVLLGEDPDKFEWRVVSRKTEELLNDAEPRQAALLMSYIGGDARQEALEALRATVDRYVTGEPWEYDPPS